MLGQQYFQYCRACKEEVFSRCPCPCPSVRDPCHQRRASWWVRQVAGVAPVTWALTVNVEESSQNLTTPGVVVARVVAVVVAAVAVVANRHSCLMNDGPFSCLNRSRNPSLLRRNLALSQLLSQLFSPSISPDFVHVPSASFSTWLHARHCVLGRDHASCPSCIWLITNGTIYNRYHW